MFPQLDHIAIAVRRLGDAPAFLVGELGGTPLAGGPGPGFTWAQWTFAGGSVLEVLEPDGPPDGFLHRFLDGRGPGVHHVTFKVANLREAADRAEANGYSPVGYDDSSPGWKECFLHPKEAQGTVVQLVESPEPGEAWEHGFRFPASPPPAESPAAIVGLRLVAHSGEAARRQWGRVAGGACEERGATLHFRWPGSPMCIAVDVDPGAASEGPRSIEVAAPPPVELSEGPHPALGVPFVKAKA